MDLKDKVALVTGASKGIGRAIALALAEAGAHVAISARTGVLLDQVAEQIRACGTQALAYAGDMRDEQQIQHFVQKTVQQFDRLDVLINNAGLGHFGKIADLSTEKWDDMFALNVRGLFLATRECLPHLRAAGESVVVNIVSLAGKNAFVGGGGYAATKHAVLGFSRCLLLEERQNGVRVLAICPGSVATEFSGDHDPEKRRHITQAEDVAQAVLMMIQMPQRAMVSEIDIRPTQP